MANNRTCFLCSKKYSYCSHCDKDMHKPSWYAMWCSETCKELDDILAGHTVGNITTAIAKSKIKELNIENLDIADENIKKHIDQILQSKDIIEKKETKEETKINEIEGIKEVKEVKKTEVTSEVKADKFKKPFKK